MTVRYYTMPIIGTGNAIDDSKRAKHHLILGAYVVAASSGGNCVVVANPSDANHTTIAADGDVTVHASVSAYLTTVTGSPYNLDAAKAAKLAGNFA